MEASELENSRYNYVYSYFSVSAVKNRRSFIHYLNTYTAAYALSLKNDVYHLMFVKTNTTRHGQKPMRKCDMIRFLYRYLTNEKTLDKGKNKRPFHYVLLLSPDAYRHIFLHPTDSRGYNWLFKIEKSEVDGDCSEDETSIIVEPPQPPAYNDMDYWTTYLTTSTAFTSSPDVQIRDLYIVYKKALLEKNVTLPTSDYVLKTTFQKLLYKLNIDITEMLRYEFFDSFKMTAQIRYDDVNFWLSYLPNLTDSKKLFEEYRMALITLNCSLPPNQYLLKLVFEKILVGKKYSISNLLSCEYDTIFSGPPIYYQLEEVL